MIVMTNQNDRWFIPDAELFEDGEPDYAGPYCLWPRCECTPWECQLQQDEAYDKHMDDLRSDEREP